MNILCGNALVKSVQQLLIGCFCLTLFPSHAGCLSTKQQQSRCKRESCKEAKYDYIVVGGGVGGCVLASRLSENPSLKVLLIDKGGNLEEGLQFEAEGPSGANWGSYNEVVIDALNDTYNQSLDFGSEHASYVCPKGLGGLSTLTDQIYLRGSKSYWDSLGYSQFRWKNMLTFFKRIENTSSIPGLNPTLRGRSGPVMVMRRNPFNGTIPSLPNDLEMFTNISKAIYKRPMLSDYNTGNLIGISPSQLSTTQLVPNPDFFPDRRQTIFKAYLGCLDFQKTGANIWKSTVRPNLDIWTNREVTSIEVSGACDKRKVKGVKIANLGLIPAKKEVILCAGAINTPRILLNSEIDDFIPEIGTNLHDHIYLGFLRYEDSEFYPDGVKPSSYVMFTSSDECDDPDIMYHVVPTLRRRPVPPKFGVPEGDDWIELFTKPEDIEKWAWQKAVRNTLNLKTDPNNIGKAQVIVPTDDIYPELHLSYQYPDAYKRYNEPDDGALFVTNEDLIGTETGPDDIPSDIEIYLEFSGTIVTDSGVFYRVADGMQNQEPQTQDETAYGGYQNQTLTHQASFGGGGTMTVYTEYGTETESFGTGVLGGQFTGSLYKWGKENPEVPEPQSFTGWNSIRLRLQNIYDADICANQESPVSLRVTGWINDLLSYDVIFSNPWTRTDVPNLDLPPPFNQIPVSITAGKLGFQLHNLNQNSIMKYRNVAYRKLTGHEPIPEPPIEKNYFDWAFHTYIVRHDIRGSIQKTGFDVAARPVIRGGGPGCGQRNK